MKFLNKRFQVKKRLRNFLHGEKDTITAYVLISCVIIVLSRLPYINLFLTTWVLCFFLIATYIFFFQLKRSAFYFLAILFMLFALISLLFGEGQLAESFGNLVYGFAFLGIFLQILKLTP